MKAIVAGTFDPFTNGHRDIVERAAQIFGDVMIAVAEETEKQPVLSARERAELVKEATADLNNVSVEIFSGALADYLIKKRECVLVRGIRGIADAEYERDHSRVYRSLCGVSTVLLYSRAEYEHISSSVVRTLCGLSCPIDEYVPDVIADKVKKYYRSAK